MAKKKKKFLTIVLALVGFLWVMSFDFSDKSEQLTYGVSLRAQDTQRVCGLTIGEQCLLMFNNTGYYVTREKDT